jgi:hypothetical protein
VISGEKSRQREVFVYKSHRGSLVKTVEVANCDAKKELISASDRMTFCLWTFTFDRKNIYGQSFCLKRSWTPQSWRWSVTAAIVPFPLPGPSTSPRSKIKWLDPLVYRQNVKRMIDFTQSRVSSEIWNIISFLGPLVGWFFLVLTQILREGLNLV